MNTLFAAIFSKFVTGTDLYDTLGGQLFYDRATEDIIEPYGVYSAITAIGEDTFSKTIDEVGIQFTFFSISLTEINNLITYCMDIYHNKILSTGHVMRRELIIPARRSGGGEDAPWQADIEFFVKNEV